MSNQSKVQAETPEEFEDLSVSKPAEKAAGLKSAYLTTKNAISKMGVSRASNGLANINQFDGFDCQSCAWADDPRERKHAEFCENGAKALADEATNKLLTADFFAQNSVADLSRNRQTQPGMFAIVAGRIDDDSVIRRRAFHFKHAAKLRRALQPKLLQKTKPGSRHAELNSSGGDAGGFSHL